MNFDCIFSSSVNQINSIEMSRFTQMNLIPSLNNGAFFELCGILSNCLEAENEAEYIKRELHAV